MDLGLLYRALNSNQVDIIAGNSTDGPIKAFGLAVLQDDKHYFPPYQAVPLVREEALQRWPQMRAGADRIERQSDRRGDADHEQRRRRTASRSRRGSAAVSRKQGVVAEGHEMTVEPWLRGTLGEMSAVPPGAVHALDLAEEDVERWCGELTDAELNSEPFGLPPIAFHLRHIARSLDRLLTYAEGRQLSAEQSAALEGEKDKGAKGPELFAEFHDGIRDARKRIRVFDQAEVEQPRPSAGNCCRPV